MRAPRLPDVFVARGREPLPRGRRGPRVTWTLLSLGFMASVAGAAVIGSIGYAVRLVQLLVDAGADDPSWIDALVRGAGTALTAAVASRATRALVLLWMREEEEAAAASGPDGRYGSDV